MYSIRSEDLRERRCLSLSYPIFSFTARPFEKKSLTSLSCDRQSVENKMTPRKTFFSFSATTFFQ